MIKNYFKIAYRNILRNKGFSIINISGLAIGMASAMLILLWIGDELSYDNFYPKRDRLYQAWNRDRGNEGINCWNVTQKILGPTLKRDYPEIEKTTRVNWDEALLLTYGEKKLNIVGNMVDPDFLTMFDFPFLKGDPNGALNRPNDMVITQKLSKALFGNEDPLGKTIRVDNKYNFTISGLLADLPNNTQFDFEFLLPWSFMHTRNEDDSSWENNSSRNFVLLKPNASIAAVNAKIQDITIKHSGPGTTVKSFLYPVSRLRLHSNFENGLPSGGKIEIVKVMELIGAFILLIACINFMNMSTARSERRAKEVGIRKVVGAQKKSLVAQFIGESILIALIAGVIAVFIVQIILPAFNTLTKKQLVLEYDHLYFWISFFGFILFTGLLAGSYPAFFLSSFRPVAVLKGSFKKVHALVTPRKVLVVLQFTFAIILIVCTIIIEKQVKYAQERESGYNKNNLTYIFLSGDILKNYELIKNDLIGRGIATSVSKTSAPLTEGWSSGGIEWPGKDPNDRTSFNFFNCDGNLVSTAGMTLLRGRDLDLKSYPTDSTAALLNEAAVKAMHLKNPVGQILARDGINWHVVGVVKDFILQSPYEPIIPMMVCGAKSDWFNLIHVKLNNSHSTAKNIADMEKVFKQYNPRYPFEYHFIDEQYANKFSDEQTTGTLSALFAGLTIFISCLGLYGLATYMAENRIKEIGVRKVLGASVASITTLLSRDFIRLVVISIGIASPVAWWSMHKWLAMYNYHISISWWIFLESGILAILIALLTISFQAVKAAVANPVKSLRSE
jgi:putative ABC transport system permease protein